MDNVERNAKSLTPGRADPERKGGPDRTALDRNANHVSSQDPCAMENCISPAALGPGGSAGARNGPEQIARNGRKLGPARTGYIQNGTRSGTDRTGPDRTGPVHP